MRMRGSGWQCVFTHLHLLGFARLCPFMLWECTYWPNMKRVLSRLGTLADLIPAFAVGWFTITCLAASTTSRSKLRQTPSRHLSKKQGGGISSGTRTFYSTVYIHQCRSMER